MKRFHVLNLFILAAAFTALTGCQQATQPDAAASQAAEQDVQSMHTQYLKAFNSKNPEAVGDFFTDDSAMLPSNAPVVRTPLAVKDYVRQMFAGQVTGLLINTDDVVLLPGGYAMDSGYYTLLGNAGVTVSHGKYMEILRKESGSWKIYRIMFNSDNTGVSPAGTSMAPAAATH